MLGIICAIDHKLLFSRGQQAFHKPQPILFILQRQASKIHNLLCHNNIVYHDLLAFPNLKGSAVEQMCRVGRMRAEGGEKGREVKWVDRETGRQGPLTCLPVSLCYAIYSQICNVVSSWSDGVRAAAGAEAVRRQSCRKWSRQPAGTWARQSLAAASTKA